ncbi:hypothetical protein PSTT_07776 [Puccinia striiformis]|uniref:Integrase catalytic domain-containing protein n=1 Tax=Puccinia striiformis TaxID=27350 RepID=A0A2S4VEZ7_9BASI|nr:hypothetical protein PSTT_07776 [Puccinia striiformis]
MADNDSDNSSSDSSARSTGKKGKPAMELPKFTGINFAIWERKVEMYLKECGLLKYIQQPMIPDPTKKMKKRAYRTASILCSNLSDDVFNTICTKERQENPYALWTEFKAVYASASILSGYEIWSKWEDTQFRNDLLKYISEIENCVAEFNSIGLKIPDFILCWSIIGRITKKRPMMMQNLFSDLNALGSPQTVIAKLREIGRYERTMSGNTVESTPSAPGTTALATNTGNGNKRPFERIRCKGKHNPAATSHTEAECWTLKPELRVEHLAKRAKPSAFHAASDQRASRSNATTESEFVRPAFGYHSTGNNKVELTTILDSGASNHMLNSLAYFESTSPVQIEIITGSGPGELMATARGDATLKLETGGTITLRDALYVPKLSRNLVSFVQLIQSKATITESDDGYSVHIEGSHTFAVDPTNNLLEIKGFAQPTSMAVGLLIQASLPFAIDIKKTHACNACMGGKIARLPFNSHFKPTKAPLEVVHADLVGPISPATNGGARYFLTIVDQHTGFIHTVILKEKSQATEAIRAYKIFHGKQTGCTIKKLVSDGGGEFCNNTLEQLLEDEGIRHNVSPPYTPQNNGLAERANRTILDMTRCLMLQANLSPEWWGEAVKTATATTNCLPSLSKSRKSPIELFFNTTPNLNLFRPFGCRVWAVKPKQFRDNKFGSNSWEGVLLGYGNDYSSYKIFCCEDRQIRIVKHAHFDETTFPVCAATNQSLTRSGNGKLPNFNSGGILPFEEEENVFKSAEQMEEGDAEQGEEEEMDQIADRLKAVRELSEGIRETSPIEKHNAPELDGGRLIIGGIDERNILPGRRERKQAFTVTVSIEPKNHKQAMNCDEHLRWKEAELKEINNMKKHDVWIVRVRVASDDPIPATWAYRKKLGSENEVIEFKARICAQGFQQTFGLNFEAKYAPTGKPASLRYLLSFAVNMGLRIHQLDVRSAFLTCPLEDKVTLLPPPGLDCPPNSVLELKKAIYGLKQAPLVWYKRLSTYLKSIGFQILMILLSAVIQVLKMEIEKEFDIKYPGEAVFLLGMNIERFSTGLQINQTQYIERKLNECDLASEHPASCPLNPREHLKKATAAEIVTFNKLDINYRALYLENPGIKHYYAAVQVFRYLIGTKNVGLTYVKEIGAPFQAFVNSDWGNCPDTRRSTTGFVVLIGKHLINWKSSKQSTISLSTTEAEYKVLSDLGRDLAWFASLSNETQIFPGLQNIKVNVDNRAAIDLAKSETSQNSFRTKHMDIRLHFVRELLDIKLIKIEYVKTTENSADYLTKPVGRATIRRSLEQLGVIQVSDVASYLATQSTRGCRNRRPGSPRRTRKERRGRRTNSAAERVSPAAIKRTRHDNLDRAALQRRITDGTIAQDQALAVSVPKETGVESNHQLSTLISEES